jgi:TRAP-type C4-dicarboxylate transport system permease small subunit
MLGKWYSEVFLYKGSRYLAITSQIALIVAMVVNVIMVVVRKLFVALGIRMGGGIVGGYEFTQCAMVFMTGAAFAWTWYNAGHIRIGLMRDVMKEKPKALLDAFWTLICFIYFILIVWSIFLQFNVNLKIHSYTPLTRIPISPFIFIFGVILAHATLVLLRSLVALISKGLGKTFARDPHLKD